VKSSAPSVHKNESQTNGESRPAPAPYSELVRRLQLTANAIDFLLGHPDLKPSDRDLGLFIIRQTLLFGKEADKNTARQQAHGVRNLNRGTGRHEKTLQRARSRLRQVGFMRVLGEPGDRRGNAYAPDFDFIARTVEKLRTPEQIAPPYPGANCSNHQSYPSGSNTQSLAASERARSERTTVAAVRALDMRVPKADALPRAPWKSVPVGDREAEAMQAHLIAITKAYPSASFGPPSRTTARDMLAAAKLAKVDATPDQVSAFLAWKFRDRRPYPYENGIRTFGGMLRMVADDLDAWLSTLPAREATRVTETDADRSADQPSEQIPEPRREEEDSFMPPAPPPTATVREAESPSPCQHCSGRGYLLDDSGTERVTGEELQTIAAWACHCSKGRDIGYGRLAAIERKEAERRGVGWIAAHFPSDSAARHQSRNMPATGRASC
jgi:hypothetical protein